MNLQFKSGTFVARHSPFIHCQIPPKYWAQDVVFQLLILSKEQCIEQKFRIKTKVNEIEKNWKSSYLGNWNYAPYHNSQSYPQLPLDSCYKTSCLYSLCLHSQPDLRSAMCLCCCCNDNNNNNDNPMEAKGEIVVFIRLKDPAACLDSCLYFLCPTDSEVLVD